MTKKEKFEALIIEYPYIYKWGKLLGSNDDYIWRQISSAIFLKAPNTTCSVDFQAGTWNTIDEITNPQTRKSLGI